MKNRKHRIDSAVRYVRIKLFLERLANGAIYLTMITGFAFLGAATAGIVFWAVMWSTEVKQIRRDTALIKSRMGHNLQEMQELRSMIVKQMHLEQPSIGKEADNYNRNLKASISQPTVK